MTTHVFFVFKFYMIIVIIVIALSIECDRKLAHSEHTGAYNIIEGRSRQGWH